MSLTAAIEPTEDLELYLGYSRPTARYADYADIRRRLMGVAPSFDFDRIMTNPDAQVIAVRDGGHVRGMAVLTRGAGTRRPVFHLYYADDAATTRALMSGVEEVLSHGQSAPNS